MIINGSFKNAPLILLLSDLFSVGKMLSNKPLKNFVLFSRKKEGLSLAEVIVRCIFATALQIK